MLQAKPPILWTRILALAGVLLVAAPLPGFARFSYLCRMTGQVSAHCCCKKRDQEQPCHAKIEQQDCCQLLKVQAQAPAPALREPVHHAAASLPVYEIVLALLALSAAGGDAAHVAIEPRPQGPPRFLVHCSFLI